jgi:hypothetical protein
MSTSTSPPPPPEAETSDDSLLVNELSFDYVFDNETGQPKRLTKGRSASPVSSANSNINVLDINPGALARSESIDHYQQQSQQPQQQQQQYGHLQNQRENVALAPRQFVRTSSAPVHSHLPPGPRRVSASASSSLVAGEKNIVPLPRRQDVDLVSLPEGKENDIEFGKSRSATTGAVGVAQPIGRSTSYGNMGAVNPPVRTRKTAVRKYEWGAAGAAARISEGETTDQDEEDGQTGASCSR